MTTKHLVYFPIKGKKIFSEELTSHYFIRNNVVPRVRNSTVSQDHQFDPSSASLLWLTPKASFQVCCSDSTVYAVLHCSVSRPLQRRTALSKPVQVSNSVTSGLRTFVASLAAAKLPAVQKKKNERKKKTEHTLRLQRFFLLVNH